MQMTRRRLGWALLTAVGVTRYGDLGIRARDDIAVAGVAG
jgi:hypothetical protein